MGSEHLLFACSGRMGSTQQDTDPTLAVFSCASTFLYVKWESSCAHFPDSLGPMHIQPSWRLPPGRTSYIECSCQLTGPLCLQPYKLWGLSPEPHHGSTYPSSPTLSPPQAHLLWHKGPGSPQLSWAHRACSCFGTSP